MHWVSMLYEKRMLTREYHDSSVGVWQVIMSMYFISASLFLNFNSRDSWTSLYISSNPSCLLCFHRPNRIEMAASLDAPASTPSNKVVCLSWPVTSPAYPTRTAKLASNSHMLFISEGFSIVVRFHHVQRMFFPLHDALCWL